MRKIVAGVLVVSLFHFSTAGITHRHASLRHASPATERGETVKSSSEVSHEARRGQERKDAGGMGTARSRAYEKGHPKIHKVHNSTGLDHHGLGGISIITISLSEGVEGATITITEPSAVIESTGFVTITASKSTSAESANETSAIALPSSTNVSVTAMNSSAVTSTVPNNGMVLGSGTLNSNGVCDCACSCGYSHYPPALGIGSIPSIAAPAATVTPWKVSVAIAASALTISVPGIFAASVSPFSTESILTAGTTSNFVFSTSTATMIVALTPSTLPASSSQATTSTIMSSTAASVAPAINSSTANNSSESTSAAAPIAQSQVGKITEAASSLNLGHLTYIATAVSTIASTSAVGEIAADFDPQTLSLTSALILGNLAAQATATVGT